MTIKLEVNGYPVEIAVGSTVLQACQKIGFTLPRFCYEDRLLIAGNCRMCLVEVLGSPKPQVACALPVTPNMKVFTDSPRAKKARELVSEFILVHHPLDCPVCDQGGECDRQDQVFGYGSDRSRYYFSDKRGVEDKDWGPIVASAMTRCIHCTRCIRYMSEYAGVPVLGTVGRGSATEVGTYMDGVKLVSEVAGNLTDLCPVGALTSKPYANKYRPWELEKVEMVDCTDPALYSIVVDVVHDKVARVLPGADSLDNGFMHDKGRYAVDARSSSNYLYRPMKFSLKNVGALGHPMKVGLEVEWDRRFALLVDVGSSVQTAGVDVVLSPTVSFEVMCYWAAVREGLKAKGLDSLMKLEVLSPSLSSSVGKGGMNKDDLFNFNGVSEADVVVIVGMDVRSEAPLVNATLRDKFLRGKVKVFSVGGNSDLTYPIIQGGVTVEGLLELMDVSHPLAKELYSSKRPMIMVSGSVLRRPDAGELMDTLRLWEKMLGTVLDSANVISGGWKVLNVHHRSAGALVARSRGINTFSGFNSVGASGSTKRPVLVTVGVETKELEEGRWALPNRAAYSSVVSFSSFLDSRVNDMADIVIPLPTYLEEAGHYLSLDGTMARSGVASSRMGYAHSLQSFNALTNAFFGMADRVQSYDKLSGLLKYVSMDVRSGGTKSSNISESVVMLLNNPVEPILNCYYTEGHALARHSATMDQCYVEYESSFDRSFVDGEFSDDTDETV